MSKRAITNLLVILLAAYVAACSETNDSVSINATVDDRADSAAGSAVASENGSVSISAPGVSANVKLPGGLLGKSNFDIDGVKLYPGATVTSMKVNSQSGDTQSAIVRVAYIAPADVAKIRAWYANGFAERAIAIARSGEGLAGKTSDGDAVTMTFAAAASGRSTGTIEIISPN